MSDGRRRRRAIGVLAAGFAVSTATPIVALALLLVGGAIRLGATAKRPFDDGTIRTAFRVYRGLAAVPLVLLAVFFVAAGAIKWDVLLVGLAWRAWLLVEVLPAAIAGWRAGSP
jgi:hypothetical protein